jgi:hypothetical protein
MLVARLRRFSLLFALSLPLTLGAVACGNSNEPKVASVKPGPMPEGQEWMGVYFSQHYGNLHLLVDGDSVSGGWKTPTGAFGELHGKAEGNLLKYEWTERTIGAVGASASRKGKGYFVYLIPKEGEAPEVHGEWGLDDNEAGNPWEAVKQKNQMPDLKQVQPDEVEGRVSGGGWDEDSKPAPTNDSGGDKGKDQVTAPE